MRVMATTVALLLAAGVAEAQQSRGLFLETVRDPGPAEGASSPRSVALGGLPPAGSAGSALRLPSALPFGRGWEVELSGGLSQYGRDNLQPTVGFSPRAGAARRPSGKLWSTPFGGSAVYSSPRWSVAAFLERSAVEHRFETDRTTIVAAFLQGTAIVTEAEGHGSLQSAQTRTGFSFAGRGRKFAAGGSLYLVNLDHDAAGALGKCHRSRVGGTPNPPPFEPCRDEEFAQSIETQRFSVRDTAPGFSVSASVTPAPWIVASVRHRREPRFTGEMRHEETENAAFAWNLGYDLPDVTAADVSLRFRDTALHAEIARAGYGGTFVDVDCETVAGSTFCTGTWRLQNSAIEDRTELRAGVEQRIPGTPLELRAGIAREPERFLRIEEDNPIGQDAPPAAGDASVRLSGGVAIRIGNGELAASAAHDRFGWNVVAGFTVRASRR